MLRRIAKVMCLVLAAALALPAMALAAASTPGSASEKSLALVVEAPSTVEPGEEFTIKVTEKQAGTPVAGASVSSTGKVASLIPGAPDSSGTSGGVLGVTGEAGELKAKIDEPGNYFLVVEKDGYTAGSRPITVKETANRFSLSIGSPTYKAGEPVTVTFRNGLSTATTLSNSAPWTITKPNGDKVFTPVATQALAEVKAGETLSWSWNQKDGQGKSVSPGVYVFTLTSAEGPVTARVCVAGLRTDKTKENSAPSMPSGRPFADVTGEVEWGDAHVLALCEKGIVKGKGDGVFDPEGTLTRAEFVAMLLRASGLEPSQDEGGDSFYDVTPSHWSYAYVYRAREMGIVTTDEYPKGFEPDVAVTRLELAVMAARALGLDKDSADRAGEELAFRDQESVQLNYRGYVANAVEWGVLKGYEDGTFRPGDNATRREACVIIYRMLGGI